MNIFTCEYICDYFDCNVTGRTLKYLLRQPLLRKDIKNSLGETAKDIAVRYGPYAPFFDTVLQKPFPSEEADEDEDFIPDANSPITDSTKSKSSSPIVDNCATEADPPNLQKLEISSIEEIGNSVDTKKLLTESQSADVSSVSDGPDPDNIKPARL